MKRGLPRIPVLYLFFALTAALGLAGCSHQLNAFFAPSTSVVHKQRNFHVVSPGVWRSAQPSNKSLTLLKSYGLKTVVNLRGEKDVNQWENKWAQKEGLRYYNFPMNARDVQNPAQLEKVLTVVGDPQNQPVLVHCAEGKDRTGLIIAMYKMKYLDASYEDAHREMLMYGYDEEDYPRLVEALRAWARENPGA